MSSNNTKNGLIWNSIEGYELKKIIDACIFMNDEDFKRKYPDTPQKTYTDEEKRNIGICDDPNCKCNLHRKTSHFG